MENFGEKRTDMISKWEEKSRDFIDAFLLLFGRDGRLVRTVILLIIYFSVLLEPRIIPPGDIHDVLFNPAMEFLSALF